MAEYHRMIEAGVFGSDERLELLEGMIVQMSPQSPRHARVIRRLCDPLLVPVPADCVAQARLPLSIEPDSEPEPDVAVVARAEAEARDHHPRSARLLFEVASDSVRKDRLAKAPVYARAGIPEYVIVNLAQDCLEVHRDADTAAARYRTVTTLTASDRFESATVPGFAFLVRDLLD